MFADHMRSLAAHRHDAGSRRRPTLPRRRSTCSRPVRAQAGAVRPRQRGPLACRPAADREAVRSPHLTAPLDVDAMVRVLGLSRSQLYRLFEPEGGIMRYLWRGSASRRCGQRSTTCGTDAVSARLVWLTASVAARSSAAPSATPTARAPRDYRASKSASGMMPLSDGRSTGPRERPLD